MRCIRSGFCCKQAPCGFGESVSLDNPACKFLGGGSPGEHYCKKYDEIISGMPENGAHISPAFGEGCCSTLNPDRLLLLKKKGGRTAPSSMS